MHILVYNKHLKVKVKWSLYRPGVAQRVGRGIALVFHDRGTRRGWVVSSTPRPQFTPGKYPVSVFQASACNMDTTPTQSQRNSNTHRTKNNMTNVVIQQNSRKLLMMDILLSETCWAHKKWNKIASDIKLFFYSSTITMVHGPVNKRFNGNWGLRESP